MRKRSLRPPAVAVVVPVYNRLRLLRETVASLRAQTLEDAEFILVDDGSEENVWAYLEALEADDLRFKAIRKVERSLKGPQASRNAGMDVATADSIVFLDSDDILAPECLEERKAEMDAAPTVDIIVGRQAIIDEKGEMPRWVNIPRPEVADLDRFLNLAHPLDVPWVNAGVMIRTSALRSAAIRWRPEFDWDDVAFHFECLCRGLTVRWSDFEGKPDAYYRRHTGDRYGKALFKRNGILSSIRMLFWMSEMLQVWGKSSTQRNKALAVSFYHACLLRAIDMNDDELVKDILRLTGDNGLVSRDLPAFRVYARGRQILRKTARATYYWNRGAERFLFPSYFSDVRSTYGTVVPNAPESHS